MSRRLDLTGTVFGKLTAIKRLPTRMNSSGFSVSYWECRCQCGKSVEVLLSSLRNGSSRSCGCMNGPSKVTHGFTIADNGNEHPVYKIWHTMLSRCFNPKVERYPRYGGRGITVCQSWRKFENFRDDMLPGWVDGLSIDRINNDGNYEPGNCRWVTRKQQANNRSDTAWLSLDGVRKTMTQWCDELNLPYHTIKKRRLMGWSDEDVLTKSIRKSA